MIAGRMTKVVSAREGSGVVFGFTELHLDIVQIGLSLNRGVFGAFNTRKGLVVCLFTNSLDRPTVVDKEILTPIKMAFGARGISVLMIEDDDFDKLRSGGVIHTVLPLDNTDVYLVYRETEGSLIQSFREFRGKLVSACRAFLKYQGSPG